MGKEEQSAAFRAAIVGAGGIARVHARIIHEIGGSVVGVCGRTLASAEAFGPWPAYDNLNRLLTEQRPDVVHICTPNNLHAEQALASFAAGAHVLCEKPLATTVAEASRMVDAAAAAGRIGAVAYCYRGYPLIEVLRARVADGDLGTLRRVGGCYLSQDVFDADAYQWHFSPGTVGASYALMDYGVHWFDLVEYVTGARITEISAQFSTHQAQRTWRGAAGQGPKPAGKATDDGSVAVPVTLEDQADLLIRLDNGAAGACSVSAVSVGHPNTIVLSADGAKAGFDWNQQEPNVYCERSTAGTLVRQRTPSALPAARSWMSQLPAGHAEGYVDAFRSIVAQAWTAMQDADTGYPSFMDGLRGVQLVAAAVDSATRRQAVVIGES